MHIGCRHIIMGSSTPIAFLADTRRLTQSSSQPLHPRHEDHGSVIFCNIKIMLLKCLSVVRYDVLRRFVSFAEGIELGEQDLKAMLNNHREKRKRQPVSGVR